MGAVELFLSDLNSNHTIFTTNFIDRYAYLYARCSFNKGFKNIVVPHGKLMSFPLDYKYDVFKLKSSDDYLSRNIQVQAGVVGKQVAVLRAVETPIKKLQRRR